MCFGSTVTINKKMKKIFEQVQQKLKPALENVKASFFAKDVSAPF